MTLPREVTREQLEPILRKTGMGWYIPPPFYGKKGEDFAAIISKPPGVVVYRWVGSLLVYMEKRKGSCQIFLYVYRFSDGKLVRKARWSGLDISACNTKFEQVVEVAREQYLG